MWALLHYTAASPYLVLLEADFIKKAVDYSDGFSHPCAQKDGRVRFESSSIGWIYMLRGGETRCSAVWSAHLFWVQRAIGSNPVTLMRRIQKKSNVGEIGKIHSVSEKEEIQSHLTEVKEDKLVRNKNYSISTPLQVPLLNPYFLK